MENSAEGTSEAHGGGPAPVDLPVVAEQTAVTAVTAVTAGVTTTAVTTAVTAAAAVGMPDATEGTPDAALETSSAALETPDATESTPDAALETPDATESTPGAALETSGVERPAIPPASLSPSRAGDFMQCPLLYRFRVIDRLPEKPSEAATRGTLVHAVLERLFDAPAAERTAPRAKSLIPGQWDRLRESRPEVVELFEDDPGGERMARWLGEAERLVERWFTLEDPTRLEPAERELFVEAELDSGLTLRGIIDRVDVAPTGEVRIVDYKTGKAPRPEYAEGALFQMKFYALVVWRLKKVVPRRLQLVYLGSGDVLTYDPVLADLERVERKLLALWEAIRQATESGDWRPRPTKLCGWCDHQAHCPEFGGTPPPYPLPVRAVGSGDVPQGRMGPD
ncbi:putative RecB family exonuclease [Streptomyces sp. SLBN-31]|nr:putative RecB family exonuclease [Streptomyces sp. SLBN-31]